MQSIPVISVRLPDRARKLSNVKLPLEIRNLSGSSDFLRKFRRFRQLLQIIPDKPPPPPPARIQRLPTNQPGRKSLKRRGESREVRRGRNFNEVSAVPSKFHLSPLPCREGEPDPVPPRSPLQRATYYLKQLEELRPRLKLFGVGAYGGKLFRAAKFLPREEGGRGRRRRERDEGLSRCGNKSEV